MPGKPGVLAASAGAGGVPPPSIHNAAVVGMSASAVGNWDRAFTITSGAGKLVVAAVINPTTAVPSSISGITWYPNGVGTPGTSQALTRRAQRVHDDGSNITIAEIWDLDSPTPAAGGTIRQTNAVNASSGNVALTLSGAAASGGGNPITAGANGTSASTGSLAVDPAVGSLILDCACLADAPITGTPVTAGQTEIADDPTGNNTLRLLSSYLASPSGALTGMEWTLSGSVHWSHTLASYAA